MARPATAGIGSGYCLMLLVSLAIMSNMRYDIVALFNNGLAQIAGVAAAAIAFSILFPANAEWHARRIERALWRELHIVRHAMRAEARHLFESGVRDLSLQWINLANNAVQAQQRLQAGIVLLETGRALLSLRSAAEQTGSDTLKTALYSVFDDALDIFMDRAMSERFKRLSINIDRLLEAIKNSDDVDGSAHAFASLQMLSLAVVERERMMNSQPDTREVNDAERA
jgi:uncharacterized membrane protein YccC